MQTDSTVIMYLTTLDLKGAYDKLEDVKVKARRAAKGLPPLTAGDVVRRIQQLARSGFGRVSQSKEVLDKMEVLCAELRKPENKASSRENLTRATHFRVDFEDVEDRLRADLLSLA